jgi:hypothetical protein
LCVEQFYVLILSVYVWHFFWNPCPFCALCAREEFDFKFVPFDMIGHICDCMLHKYKDVEFDFKFVPFDMIGHICDCMLHKDKDVVFKDCYQDHGGYQFEFGYENVQRTKVGEL